MFSYRGLSNPQNRYLTHTISNKHLRIYDADAKQTAAKSTQLNRQKLSDLIDKLSKGGNQLASSLQ